jgi:fumarate reductase flavoprotein subunit
MNCSEASDVTNLETEIVVIGAGGSGLAAAVAASENGAQAIVLEKRRNAGGNALLASGLFAAESPVQRRQKIYAPKGELFKRAMDFAHWKINPRIVRAFIDKSGETIRWLEDKGLKFGRIPALFPNQNPLVWHVPEGGGRALIYTLAKNCTDLGVRVFYQTTARKLLTDESGSVIGVLAVTGAGKEEKEIRIVAKSAIIATGGYGGNKELLRKYCPEYIENMPCKGLPLMGDGILMATEVGGATEGLGILQKCGPWFPGSTMLWSDALDPRTIWVNKKGERFIDEAVGFNYWESVNALMRQPDKICYALFDDEIKQDFIKEGPNSYAVLSIEPGEIKQPGLDRELQVQAAKGEAKIADSWDEIAQWIGANAEVLTATVEEYNTGCDRGYDEIFDKDRTYLASLRTTPYYALRCCATYLGTIGGIKVDHRMEVIDCNDNPITGLYAVGVDTGGWEPDTYNARLAGTTLGFAVNSGRIAGENAVKYVLGR